MKHGIECGQIVWLFGLPFHLMKRVVRNDSGTSWCEHQILAGNVKLGATVSLSLQSMSPVSLVDLLSPAACVCDHKAITSFVICLIVPQVMLTQHNRCRT